MSDHGQKPLLNKLFQNKMCHLFEKKKNLLSYSAAHLAGLQVYGQKIRQWKVFFCLCIVPASSGFKFKSCKSIRITIYLT